MAADWLDGARFADSNGYQNDFSRNMSPWRDWVIGAFNKGMHSNANTPRLPAIRKEIVRICLHYVLTLSRCPHNTICPMRPLALAIPLSALLWLIAGGLAYTAGTLFFANERLRYGHFIWHLFVLAGSSCHFVAVFICAI